MNRTYSLFSLTVKDLLTEWIILCNNAHHEIPILNLVVVFLLCGNIKLCVFAQRLGCWGDLASGALPVVPYSPLSVSVARKIC